MYYCTTLELTLSFKDDLLQPRRAQLPPVPLMGFVPLQRFKQKGPVLSSLPHSTPSVFRVFHPLDVLLPSCPSGLVSCQFRSWGSFFRAFFPAQSFQDLSILTAFLTLASCLYQIEVSDCRSTCLTRTNHAHWPHLQGFFPCRDSTLPKRCLHTDQKAAALLIFNSLRTSPELPWPAVHGTSPLELCLTPQPKPLRRLPSRVLRNNPIGLSP